MARIIDISSSDDQIDIRDVIERFEELEAQRKPWRAGWNMPGYMPDSEPAGFESFADAVEYLKSEIEDVIASFEHPDICAETQAALQDVLRDLDQADEMEFGQTAGNYHYWIAKVDGEDAFDDADEHAEYAKLKSLLDDLRGYGGDEEWRGDWYPITLINEAYFVEAMKELCADIGDIPRDMPSYIEIDWDATAKNLKVDYSEIDFDGVTFLYR